MNRRSSGYVRRGGYLIWITRLNQKTIVLNSDLIEQIETTPDTLITLTGGQKITALESPQELIERVREYRQSLGTALDGRQI